MRISIYTDREATIQSAEYISKNRSKSYIGTKGNFTYYNVNGIVWEVYQDGTGTNPTTEGIRIEDFTTILK